jgi:O-antigen/teichoic acid export membrane protein
MTTLRRNVLFTYASQIYATVIGIVIVPVYIGYMGLEAYGLVGFYAMLQAWFLLLDLGLAPTMAREVARFRGGGIQAEVLRRLLQVLERIFVLVALVGALLIWTLSPWIATQWLQVEALPHEQVLSAVRLMALILGFRWIASLYRSAIGGFEQQVWLGKVNTVIATCRFVFVLAIFEYIGTTPAHFFGYQLVIAVLEVGVLALKTHRLMPRRSSLEGGSGTGLAVLGSVYRFSLSVAFTGSVWVFVTQSDKLLLSRLLTLSEYAHFTLAVLLASGVSIVAGPLSTAVLPRLTRLHTQARNQEMLDLYRKSTRWMVVIAAPVSAVLASSAYPLVQAWTGNADTASRVAPILAAYATGNGRLAVSAFPYYLQYARGNLKLHLYGSAVFVGLLLPLLFLLARDFGATGAGMAWLIVNGAYALFWVGFVHWKLVPGLHLKWLTIDVLPGVLVAAASATLFGSCFSGPTGRWESAARLLFIGLATQLAVACAVSDSRAVLVHRFNSLTGRGSE